MYFQRSADIAAKHQSLAQGVDAVDELLYSIGDFPVRPDHVADNLQLTVPVLKRILRLYANAGLIREEKRRYCANCDLLIDDEKASWCDQCETEFRRRSPDEHTVFVVCDPIIRTEPHAAEESEDETTVIIQFIAGDRGGGQRHQLQTHREFKAIQTALNAGEHRESFRTANPLHAVTVLDVGTAYESNPDILHFVGHGDERTLSVIVDKTVVASAEPLSGDQLVSILGSFPRRVRVCLLNTCGSHAIAEALAIHNVADTAIGWDGKVPDAVAVGFSAAFYRHLANGLSVGQAFTLSAACCGASAAGVNVQLRCRADVDAKRYFLVHG